MPNPLQTTFELKKPSLLKLGASLVYEALVIIALCFAGALLFITVVGDATLGIKRYLLQLFLWLVVGAYFVWCWLKSGQTLAMHTWHLSLVRADHRPLSIQRAIARYVLASLSLLLIGLGFLWAIIDHDRRFLHDRLLDTKIGERHLRSTL
jgi:uncharacterized RDD family membrane protein YckC